MSADRLSFSEACRKLGISEDELERIVAAGEIASIKEGDTLYFKKEVVERFKQERDEPALLLSDEEINLLDDVEELDLLGSDDQKKPVKAEVSTGDKTDKVEPAREEISLDDDLELPDLDLGTEETADVPDEEVVVKKRGEAEDDTLLSMEGILEDDSEATTPVPGSGEDDTLLDTDLLDLAGETDPFAAGATQAAEIDELTEPGTLLRGGGARVMQMKRKKSEAGWTIGVALAAMLLLPSLGILTNVIFLSSADGETPKGPSWVSEYNLLQGPIQAVADFFKPRA